MDAHDARIVLAEARSWAARGLISPAALEVLEREYTAAAAATTRDEPGVGLSILYALAGVLLGAACVAVPILVHAHDDVVPWFLLGLGSPLLAFGVVLWRLRGPAGIVDALLIGSLVPLTAMGAPDLDLGRVLSIVGLLAALAVTWLPRASTTVPILGNIAIFAALGISTHQVLHDVINDGDIAWVWLALGGAQLTACLLVGRREPSPTRTLVLALLCVGLVVPFVLGLDHAVPSHNTRFYELCVGAFELAILLIGLGVRERGLVLGAAIVVAVDAIAYAFETNVLLGIGVLLGVAILLILLATTLKRSARSE